MSAGVVAFLLAISSATWIFTKLQDKTGYGNNRSAFIGAAVCFVLIFIVAFTIGHMIIK